MTWMSRFQGSEAKCASRWGKSGGSKGVKRSPAFWSLCAQVGLLALGLVFSVASGSKGDRAESGACPEGEVCSPDTPDGLYFQGPGFADGFLNYDVHVTAVGGTQTIEIDPVGLYHDLSSFEAEVTDPALSVTMVAPPLVTITGESVGSGYLRIYEVNTGALYDRLTVSAQEVDTIEVEPVVWETELADDPPDPMYWGGDPLPWIARLYGSGVRLVDESIVFGDTGTANAAVSTEGVWDLAEVTPTTGSATVAVAVTSGSGFTGIGEVDVVHSVDFLVEDPEDPVPATHDASDTLSVCFAAYSGSRRVLGVPFEFHMTGPQGETLEDDVSANPFAWNCSMISDIPAPGTWQLEVIAGDYSETFDIEVTVSQPAPPPPPMPTSAPPFADSISATGLLGSPGSRARWVLAPLPLQN